MSFNSVQAKPSSETTEYCLEGQIDCTLVIFSEQSQQKHVINAKRADTAFSPFSTFKVPNSVIGLELGLIENAEQVMSFDKEKYPPQQWWPSVWKLPEYSLSTAFKFSMVAVYRQLASDIGSANMQQALKRFNYGNQDISSGLDSFWLNGSMKISANEQITFLQKLNENTFSIKEKSLATIKQVMLAGQDAHYKMYAKTGAGKVDDNSMLGWYVGFVENKAGTHYFAFNFNRKTYGEMKKSRTQIVINHLKKLAII
ncbi:penicillin-binding transpeptidase domain-containing protein [Thalassotalea sp. PLHSN55]|uniref:penicillin-binding transpeptidase domain-containing protein n=1 Tax=Thalassotalea sp. PLHSN55 TaxID=3435888 RepID=UPI003F82C6B0